MLQNTLAVTAMILMLATSHAVAQSRTGATGQFPDGTTVNLPDCRTCTVKQTGPNSYEVHIPKDVRNKVNGTTTKK